MQLPLKAPDIDQFALKTELIFVIWETTSQMLSE